MKQNWLRISVLSMAMGLLTPVSLMAQDEKDKSDKGDKVKKEVQTITVTRRGDKKDEKVVIEINGDKITVNGKPLDEYKDKDGDLTVSLNKWKDMESLFTTRFPKGMNWEKGDNFDFFTADDNRAMLGVTTQKTDEGVEVQTVTKESGAEKAGLKEKDIITRIDDKKITDPDELSEAVKKHKPGDKISITYLRDKKEQKATAELTKWKGVSAWTGDMRFDNVIPKTRISPAVPYFTWSDKNPKLGLSVQDSDEGKGVKVIGVDDESNAAKAGIREDDLITEADGKVINNADDIVKVIKESKDKNSIMIKLQRGGKTMNVEVKMPRKLKSANL